MSPRARRPRRPNARDRVIVQRAVRVACVVLVLSASAPFAASAAPRGEPRIVAAVPDPVAAGDVGEYVVVDAAGARNLTLSDGERTVPIPPLPSPPRPPPRRRDDRGRRDLTALSTAPNATRSLLDASSGDRRTVRVVEADLRLANAGERLVLRRDGVVVDRLDYDGAREGARLNATTGRWVPRGLRLRPVVATGPAEATAFVLPDAPGVPLETLRDADERILLAGYTFASARVTAALLAAAERGVRVRVLLEGGPIGGMTTTQREHLDRLVAGGVEVRLLVGPHDRFAYHHAKYAVVDETALVLTENWKPAGTGGRDSRGWGVRVRSGRTAAELAAVFEHDADGRDAVPWRERRRNATVVDVAPAAGSYDGRFAPTPIAVDKVRVLTAPGNAGAAIRRSIADADERVDVVVPRLDPRGAYFAALVAAAERGVRVRILLSNAWYDEASNRALVARAARLRDRGLPIEARIARPAGRFGKVHAKGAVIDGETALVGSLNWNTHSAAENREVVLALDGAEPAAYYGRVFAADWAAAGGSRAGGASDRHVTLTMALGVLAALALAAFVLRRTVTFE